MNAHVAQGKFYDAPLDRLIPGNPFDEKTVQGLVESFNTTGRQISRLLVREGEGHKLIVIAGNNRLEAAKRVNWPTLMVDEVPFETERDQLLAELLTLDENDRRKDVTPIDRALHDTRRAEIYLKLYPDADQHGGDRKSEEAKSSSQLGNLIEPQKSAENEPSFELKAPKAPKADRTAKAIAKDTGKSEMSVRRNIARGALPAAMLKEMKGYKHLNVGKELDAMLDLDAERREEVLAAARDGKKLKPSTALKQEQRRLKEISLAGKQQALPATKFGVLYLDPPWKFEVFAETTGRDRSAENHYPTLTMDELEAMPIGDLGHDDSAMFMWSTGAMLKRAMALMEGYGYNYVSQVIWKKEGLGTGYWFRECHEILLLGIKGHPPGIAPGKQVASVIEAPRGPHSRKPEQFYRIIESYFPTLSKAELFARGTPRKGWVVWGNESSDNVEAEGAPRTEGETSPAPASELRGEPAETVATNPKGEPRGEAQPHAQDSPSQEPAQVGEGDGGKENSTLSETAATIGDAPGPGDEAISEESRQGGNDGPTASEAISAAPQTAGASPSPAPIPPEARLISDAAAIDRSTDYIAEMRRAGFDAVYSPNDLKKPYKPLGVWPGDDPNFDRGPDVAPPKMPSRL